MSDGIKMTGGDLEDVFFGAACNTRVLPSCHIVGKGGCASDRSAVRNCATPAPNCTTRFAASAVTAALNASSSIPLSLVRRDFACWLNEAFQAIEPFFKLGNASSELASVMF